jgi:hypothetical protein
MSDETVGGVHWSFWAIGAVALIWNVMGSINFFVQMERERKGVKSRLESCLEIMVCSAHVPSTSNRIS